MSDDVPPPAEPQPNGGGEPGLVHGPTLTAVADAPQMTSPVPGAAVFVASPPRARRPAPLVHRTGSVVAAVCVLGFIVCGQTVFAGLAGTLFVLGLTLSLVLTGTVRRAEAMLWLGSASVLAIGLSLRASPWLITLNMAAICLLVLVGVLTARSASLFRCSARGVTEAIERLVGSWATSPAIGARWVFAARQLTVRRRSTTRPDGGRSRWGSAARSLLLAVPVLVVVVPLLSAGDAAFANVLGGLGRACAAIAGSITVDTSIVMFGLAGAWVGLTLLAIAGATSRPEPTHTTPLGRDVEDHRSDGRADLQRSSFVREVVGAMWIVNVTLLGFVATQVSAVAGVSARLHHDALSYQEIAKDGFFPLLAASAFVLTSLLVAHVMLRGNRWERRSIVSAQTMVLLNLAIVVVASRRLWVGADVWGLTMLRLCSQAAAVLLGVMLLTIAWWQRRERSHQPIVGTSVAASVVLLVLMNALPVEQYIVNWNADRPSPSARSAAGARPVIRLDPTTSKELGVAQCADYFDKWHGRNADAMPAFAPLLAQQFANGVVDQQCVDVMLHCGATFDVGGLRWNFAKARANNRQAEWCRTGAARTD